jgi:NAD(P)-dependent dehydrogenase (short-subunit alcohol dehydrogenase family)
MRSFEGRVAVVTGAASGIGRGLAEACAGAGMKVVLADVRPDALEATARSLRDGGAEVRSVVTDVRDSAQVQALADETVSAFGGVHLLCNNAGVAGSSSLLWEGSIAEWDWHIGVMLMGTVHGIRSFVPVMLDRGDEAHVVNTASMGGLITGSDSQAIYMTVKHGVVALSEALQHQLSGVTDRIGCSVLCPAWVASDVFANFERLRPAGVSSPAATSEGAALVELQQQFLAAGMPARQAGELVLEAVRNRQFYVLTHPAWASMAEARAKAIVEGNDPARPAPPLD